MNSCGHHHIGHIHLLRWRSWEARHSPAERRTFTTLAALWNAEPARAEGPVVVCAGEVFRDAAGELKIEQPTHAAMNEHR